MTTTQTPVQARLEAVLERIEKACDRFGRARDSLTLVAVSKTQPAEAIREAHDAGQLHFGENYVQEGIAKIDAFGGSKELVWHFIGPIQSNKTRTISQNFQWVHTIDREKVALRLSDQRERYLPPLCVCLEVNISGETSKSGVAPSELPALAESVAALPGLHLRGLMAIPEPTSDEVLSRRRFEQLRELRDSLNQLGHKMDTLSMGMTADMEAAIAEGATLVRIGTAIFGERK
jgi:hypothetical protein